MDQAYPWYLCQYRMKHERHGAFFVSIDPSAGVSASRVYTPRDAAEMKCERLGEAYSTVLEAMRACEQRIAELELEAQSRCECGAALAHIAGPRGLEAVLCPVCDADHAAALEPTEMER